MKNKRKVTTAIIASVTALALLLGGTFAWQSINQTALNEASDVINPGGRLHDDFNGSNKDVYVENFADEPIFARIQLSEYFGIIANYGKEGAETKTDIAGTATITDGKIVDPEYAIHYFDQTNATDEYWTWETGGKTVYMPTFNMNKDSLVADINGTYVGAIGGISNRDGNQYTDYTEYEVNEIEEGTEIYDGDTNMNDEVGTDLDNWASYPNNIVAVENATHTAKETGNGTLISMAEWLAMVDEAGGYNEADHGSYWVYDTDGWVYWSAPIASGEATGLLLDEINLTQVMDDTWYYAINVVAQFVTADDVGETDGTGFYDTANGSVPTPEAESLLDYIGVDMGGDSGDEVPAVATLVYNGSELTMVNLGETYADLTVTLPDAEGTDTAQTVTGWSIANNTSADTTVADGTLTIAADEAAATLELQATIGDGDVRTFSLTVIDPNAAFTLSATTGSVEFTNAARTDGVDLGLSAAADGEAVDLSGATLYLTGNTSTDTVLNNGVLTLGEDETANTITVHAIFDRAHSSVDVTVYYMKVVFWNTGSSDMYNLDAAVCTAYSHNRDNLLGRPYEYDFVVVTCDNEILELEESAYVYTDPMGDCTFSYVSLETAASNDNQYDDGHSYGHLFQVLGCETSLTVTWNGRTETFAGIYVYYV